MTVHLPEELSVEERNRELAGTPIDDQQALRQHIEADQHVEAHWRMGHAENEQVVPDQVGHRSRSGSQLPSHWQC